MLVVSDVTPLHALIRIELLDILATLYGQVVIPPAVAGELSHLHAPKEVRDWILTPPEWLTVKHPTHVDPALASGAGEREAISLALELKADFLMADDKEARTVARGLKLATIGTMGILELASIKGLIELRPAIEKLSKGGFYIDEEIISLVLKRNADRQT